jgi:hypothetical protein
VGGGRLAIRLKQLCQENTRELSVYAVERAPEIGELSSPVPLHYSLSGDVQHFLRKFYRTDCILARRLGILQGLIIRDCI